MGGTATADSAEASPVALNSSAVAASISARPRLPFAQRLPFRTQFVPKVVLPAMIGRTQFLYQSSQNYPPRCTPVYPYRCTGGTMSLDIKHLAVKPER